MLPYYASMFTPMRKRNLVLGECFIVREIYLISSQYKVKHRLNGPIICNHTLWVFLILCLGLELVQSFYKNEFHNYWLTLLPACKIIEILYESRRCKKFGVFSAVKLNTRYSGMWHRVVWCQNFVGMCCLRLQGTRIVCSVTEKTSSSVTWMPVH